MSTKLPQSNDIEDDIAEFYFSLVEQSANDRQDFMNLLKQVSDHVGKGPEADKALNKFFEDFRSR